MKIYPHVEVGTPKLPFGSKVLKVIHPRWGEWQKNGVGWNPKRGGVKMKIGVRWNWKWEGMKIENGRSEVKNRKKNRSLRMRVCQKLWWGLKMYGVEVGKLWDGGNILNFVKWSINWLAVIILWELSCCGKKYQLCLIIFENLPHHHTILNVFLRISFSISSSIFS